MSEAAPLILALAFDAASLARLDALRRAHFPPARNLLRAHLTLFHALPGQHEPAIMAELAAVCARQAPIDLALPRPRSLGRGVAIEVVSPALLALRRQLAGAWAAWLGPQDRQGFQPHVTIQNKVAPAVAQALLAELAASWRPLAGRGEGLALWRYRGGPWEAVATVPFSARIQEAAP